MNETPRRQAILSAASRLFRHYGPFKTTVADIAREAGVGVGTVYLEFRSKDAILAALSRARHEHVLAAVERAWADGRPAHERLERALAARLEAFLGCRSEGAHGRTSSCACPAVEDAHRAFVEAEHALFARFLREAMSRDELAVRDPDGDARGLLLAYRAFEPPLLYELTLEALGARPRARAPHRARGLAPARARRGEGEALDAIDASAACCGAGAMNDELGPITIGGVEVGPGERRTIEIPVARLPTAAGLAMPIHLVRGRKAGPSLFVSAAIHGDEINGVEIVGRLLRMKALERMRGTLIAVPVVNVFGFSGYSRYLPDRRDLNRSFPGSERGSPAARLAHIFMEEVVGHATHGIDLHTGALHRTNLPQLRVTQETAPRWPWPSTSAPSSCSRARCATARCARRPSSGRCPSWSTRAAEALRFDEWAIRAGLRGVIATMHHLDMPPTRRKEARPLPEPVVSSTSVWIRAPEGGILRTRASLGARVARGDTLGTIGDAYGHEPVPVRAPGDAIVIGRTQLPVVNEGDALFHLLPLDARHRREALEPIEAFQAENPGVADRSRGRGLSPERVRTRYPRARMRSPCVLLLL
ncbi:MAG: succinylglutamate desuccinylase/aspartoacylase family protein, partial [Sandaracinaceae bacterium]|nr:succinylglutamate desuccinylase/aspartoacylase family protein [Sandaracinaceae bacterium]